MEQPEPITIETITTPGPNPKRLNILNLEQFNYSIAADSIDKEYPLPDVDKSLVIEDMRQVDVWLYSKDNLIGCSVAEASDEQLARFILMIGSITTQLSQARRTKFSKRVESELESIKADHQVTRSFTSKDVVNRPKTVKSKAKPCKSGSLLLREKLNEAYEIHCKECNVCLLASRGTIIERKLGAEEKLKNFTRKVNEGIIDPKWKSLRAYVVTFDLDIPGYMNLSFDELKLAVAKAEGKGK